MERTSGRAHNLLPIKEFTNRRKHTDAQHAERASVRVQNLLLILEFSSQIVGVISVGAEALLPFSELVSKELSTDSRCKYPLE